MNNIEYFIDRDCPECGKIYQANITRLKHGRQTTCSRSCSYSLRANKLCAERNTLICPVCLTSFERLKSKKISQVSYCSSNCAYKGRTLGLTKRRIKKPYVIVNSQKKPVFVECLSCNKTITTIPALKHRKKFCSKKCNVTHQKITMKGELNPSWVDGRSYKKRCYRGVDWEVQRNTAYKRDNYICRNCGAKCISRKAMTKDNANRLIQCHHIVFWKDDQNNSLENLVTLCASCHAKIHFGKADINEPT